MEMKEHWVFIEGRHGSPMICSRIGVRIYFMDREDDGPDLETRVPGLQILFDKEKNSFKIVRLNDKTGMEIVASEQPRSRSEQDRVRKPNPLG
jgi:hypothetical protein